MLAQPGDLRRVVVGLETGIAPLAVVLFHELDDAVIGIGKDADLHRPTFRLQLLHGVCALESSPPSIHRLGVSSFCIVCTGS